MKIFWTGLVFSGLMFANQSLALLPGEKAKEDKVVEKKKVAMPVVVKLDTGDEILKIMPDGKVYSEDKLITEKVLTIATKTVDYQRCTMLLGDILIKQQSKK